MWRSILTCSVFLATCTPTFAGVAITLVPTPQSPAGYQPGEVVYVDVMAQLTPGTPSVSGPGGTTNSIRVRMMQFDLSDTDAALQPSVVNHYYDEYGVMLPFWDLAGTRLCDPEECLGINYFVDGEIMGADQVLNITYLGFSSSGAVMLSLNQQPKRVGELIITIPQLPGAYLLDVLNADETDPNQGAEIRWGFGSTADPTDPTSPLRANTGGISGGQFAFTVVPEPGTLALLGLGGLILSVRRRLNLQAA